ncbi:hypothetical protein GMDG_05881 [Pseudogymnoascus destructans 20631-21]|uniref:Methyltransferase type 12 domain-containing protein n=1 Tax=Pseudogymnoascus destructans (strain ATCC MYA-4855 / 20631-21) TaxID=658429 RepID=L8FPY7_PSED2|nr:hypothetical protein GMDG_05881 [Pseudogymnoascus destructans 20631-21]
MRSETDNLSNITYTKATSSSTLEPTELGCGTGRNTAKLLLPPSSTKISSIHALDRSPSMLDIARQRCSAITADSTTSISSTEFHVFDAPSDTAPPEEACGADAVLSALVLEHLAPAVFFGSVKKLLAKERGHLLVTNMHEEMGRGDRRGLYSIEEVVEEVVEEGRKMGV